MIKMKQGVIATTVSHTIRIFVKVLFAMSSVRSVCSALSVSQLLQSIPMIINLIFAAHTTHAALLQLEQC